MKIYTSTNNGNQIELCRKYGLGVVCTPSQPPHKDCTDVPLIVDNGAFTAWRRGIPFPEAAFLNLISNIYKGAWSPDFVVVPDIVGGGLRSLDFSATWAVKLGGGNLALAVQDGMIPRAIPQAVPMGYFTHIFVGGSVEWKWDTAKSWVQFARENGKKCHIGQVGTVERLRYAEELGADSVDSANFARNDSWEVIGEFLNPIQTRLDLLKFTVRDPV